MWVGSRKDQPFYAWFVRYHAKTIVKKMLKSVRCAAVLVIHLQNFALMIVRPSTQL
jgi:hypothetical protein